ncbi:MAG: presqualene diphosphate synthase HpnD [Chloroflexi bacterium]|nr:presqualene diphosphate synthase HpnD [Chloroflexota bacterium]
MVTELDQAYEYCRRLTRERAKNFYYAFVTLPPRKRKAIYAAYAFCRLCDDATDEAIPTEEKLRQVKEQRENLRQTYAGAPDGPVLLALKDTIETYGIPQEYLEEVVNGVEMDVRRNRYATFDELKEYCYRVASAVGLICIEIFGYKDPRAREHAIDLGIAMQLTNILRDIQEDLERDRIYIPLEDMERFGYSEEALLRGEMGDPFQALMRFQVGRAREYFQRGKHLLPMLSYRARACPAVLHGLYSRLLDRIEDADYNVFNGRISLSTREKLALTARIWVMGIAMGA